MEKVKLCELEPLTKKQKKQIQKAKRFDIYDEDNPELSDEQLSQFRRVHYENQLLRRKEVLSLRVYPATISKAKALGPGYTNICARLLDLALDNPELIKKCL